MNEKIKISNEAEMFVALYKEMDEHHACHMYDFLIKYDLASIKGDEYIKSFKSYGLVKQNCMDFIDITPKGIEYAKKLISH